MAETQKAEVDVLCGHCGHLNVKESVDVKLDVEQVARWLLSSGLEHLVQVQLILAQKGVDLSMGLPSVEVEVSPESLPPLGGRR